MDMGMDMDTVYDNAFWSSIHKFVKSSADLPQDLSDSMKNDEKCATLLISLFTCYKGAPKTQLFRLLLDSRDDWLTFRIPEYQKDENEQKYNGLSILHLVMLLKPCKAYLNLLLCTPEILELKDADGNTILYYAIKSNLVTVYERTWKLTGGDGQSALNPGPQTCALFLKADSTHILKTIGLKHIVDTLGGYDKTLSTCLAYNATGIIEQLFKAFPLQILDLNDYNYIDTLMNDSNVRYVTFRTVLDLILLGSQDCIEKFSLKYPAEVIGKRLWDLAGTRSQRNNALYATRRFAIKLKIDLNIFVSLTGYTYDQLYLKNCIKALGFTELEASIRESLNLKNETKD